MKDTDFIFIPGWAVNKLKLKGNELMIYSIIFSYSRDGIQWYQAPAEYLATCVGASVSTVKECLKKLSDRGYITRREETYKGAVRRVYYQAVVPENDQYRNGTGEQELPVPKRYSSTSTETVLNNTNNNISNNKPSTPSSSRHSLFNKGSNSDKQKKEKIEQFVCKCHHISLEFDFEDKVSDKLVDFFRMLGESDSFLPDMTIRAQLEDLVSLLPKQQFQAVSDTIKSGWKSLKYSIDSIKKSNTASFDTTSPGSFQPKDPKNDRRSEDYTDDEVF